MSDEQWGGREDYPFEPIKKEKAWRGRDPREGITRAMASDYGAFMGKFLIQPTKPSPVLPLNGLTFAIKDMWVDLHFANHCCARTELPIDLVGVEETDATVFFFVLMMMPRKLLRKGSDCWTVNCSFDVEGQVTGFGNPDWARTHSAACSTAPSVLAVLEAGATCIGKTVMDEMAYRFVTT